MTRKNPFKYVVEDRDRYNVVRVYYRPPKAEKKIRIWVSKEHPDFVDHYVAAKAGNPLPKPKPNQVDRPPAGTFAALVDDYEHSAKFRASVNPLGRKTQLAILRGCCAEILPRSGKKLGDIPLDKFETSHVLFLQDRKAGLPGAANNRLKYLRALFAWAVKGKRLSSNPATLIDMLPAVRKDGHHAWTLAEIAKFEARHPVGTTARLALDLALYTAARRSDLVELGPDNIDMKDGWLGFEQNKTGGKVELPILPALANSLAAARTGDKTFLITVPGKPYTANGFGNAFRDWCDEAGLPHCAVHGLRKAAASKLAEIGCSHEQIKAITGHVTSKEIERYTQAARRRLMAKSAYEKLKEFEEKKSNSLEPTENCGTLSEEQE